MDLSSRNLFSSQFYIAAFLNLSINFVIKWTWMLFQRLFNVSKKQTTYLQIWIKIWTILFTATIRRNCLWTFILLKFSNVAYSTFYKCSILWRPLTTVNKLRIYWIIYRIVLKAAFLDVKLYDQNQFYWLLGAQA